MRLARPYIPLSVRVAVAERQSIAAGKGRLGSSVLYKRLAYALELLFGGQKAELHHRPSLVNRRRYVRNGKTFYDPPANDPDHLIYLRAGRGEDHDVETRVRGVGAQLSDLAQVRKRKRKERKAKRVRRRWPSRPFPKASRKLRSRKWT